MMTNGYLRLTSKQGPCKDCPDRYVGCHSQCAKYLAFQKEIAEERKEKQRMRGLREYVEG